MATVKSKSTARTPPSVPPGVTVQMLARALFLDSMGEHTLPPAELQLRWKAEAPTHLKRASRMANRLTRMTAKSAA